MRNQLKINAFSLFQFHKGAIRTFAISQSSSLFVNFNSIKVRLELLQVFLLDTIYINFNSIKVRLEPAVNLIFEEPLPIFQFHKGAIRTKKQV